MGGIIFVLSLVAGFHLVSPSINLFMLCFMGLMSLPPKNRSTGNTTIELAKTQQEKDIATVFTKMFEGQRSFMGPPDMAAAEVNVWPDILKKIFPILT